MRNFVPNMYKKNIFEIDYHKLKKLGIKILIYDFDNTIVEKGKINNYDELKIFFKELKKDFKVYIISNTISKGKIDEFSNKCEIPYVMNACKPLSRGFRKVKELSHVKPNEICMIGDQLLTDIWGSNRLGYYSIYLTPIGKDEYLITRFNRMIEKSIYNKVCKKYGIERGKYYD